MPLTDLLLFYAYMEKQIDTLREQLCEQPDFIPYNLFRYIDKLKECPSGYLTKDDLTIFLRLCRFPTDLNTQLFISNHNQNKDGNLVYSEFLKAILPMGNQIIRERASLVSPTENLKVPEKILYTFAKLIEVEIKLQQQAESFKSIYYEDLFKNISYDGYILPNELFDYFAFERVQSSQQEINLIFNRIDLCNDGKIDIHEWRQATIPQKQSNHTAKSDQKNTRNYIKIENNYQLENQYHSAKKPLTPNTPSKYQQQKTELRAQMRLSLLNRSTSAKNKETRMNKEQLFKGSARKSQKPQLFIQDVNITPKVQQRKEKDPLQFFIKLFLDLIENEIKTERTKEQLCNQENFSLFNAFQSLDKEQRGFLMAQDLKPLMTDPVSLLQRYGKEFKLRFSAFIKMIEPKNPHIIQKLQQNDLRIKQQRNLNQQTNTILKILLEQLTFKEQMIKQTSEYMQGQKFNLRDIFNAISYDKTHMSIKDISDLFLSNNQNLEKYEIQTLIDMMDIDQDGVVNYDDFRQFF